MTEAMQARAVAVIADRMAVALAVMPQGVAPSPNRMTSNNVAMVTRATLDSALDGT